MLEEVYQEDSLIAEPQELSPADQLRVQWTNQPGLALIRQKNVIERCPELLSHVSMASLKGWKWPYSFAFQGLVIAAVAISLLNWYATHDNGRLHQDIARLQASTQAESQRQQGITDATNAEILRITHSRSQVFKLQMSQGLLTREQALAELNASLAESQSSLEQFKQRMAQQERELRAKENALAIARSGVPLLFSLALLLCAGGVRKSIQGDNSRSRVARSSGDYFLYFATTEGLLLNIPVLILVHLMLSGGSYGLSGFFESVGPLLQVIFWIGLYALMLRYFVGITRGMHKALQLRPPANEWSPENRILLHIHNNLFAVLAVLEGSFLTACYVLYHIDKRFF
ncbi:MAG TPA: hypothetical protein VFY05_09635 [Candidatus Angelobacter sp.]|nr:hypothetical protein [Candidatus Angelobacter sp.]